MVLVNYGPDEGKLAVILDVADNNKVGASLNSTALCVCVCVLRVCCDFSVVAGREKTAPVVLPSPWPPVVVHGCRKQYVGKRSTAKMCSTYLTLIGGTVATIDGTKTHNTYTRSVASAVSYQSSWLSGDTGSSASNNPRVTRFYVYIRCGNRPALLGTPAGRGSRSFFLPVVVVRVVG